MYPLFIGTVWRNLEPDGDAAEGARALLSEGVWEELTAKALLFLPRCGTALVLFAVFWFAGVVARRIICRLSRAHHVNQDIMNLLGGAAKTALLTFGAVTSLGTLGVEIAGLVAGLGLTGFALSFALKDIISNALAGVLILIYEPFRRNDRIAVTSLEGIVVGINLRYTILEAPDKRILIPNSNLFTNPITVVSTSQKVSTDLATGGGHSE